MTIFERAKLASRLIATGDFHTLAVKSDGTVLSTGKNWNRQCEVNSWTDIAAVAAGNEFSVGICRNGTVVTCGKRHQNSKNVLNWRNIVAASAGATDIIGLTADEKAVLSSNSLHARETLSNISSVEASGYSTLLGVSKTGRVKVVGCNDNDFIDYISQWQNVVAVAAGQSHVIALYSNGVVSAIWDERYNFGQCNTKNWRNIIAIAAGIDHTVGLKADGTVVASGPKGYKACNVSGWRNIIAISAGKYHTVGLKSDGTLVATGENNKGQCNVTGWKLF